MSKSKVVMIGEDAHQKLTWFDERTPAGSPIWKCRCSCGRMPVQTGTPVDLGRSWRKHIEDVAQFIAMQPRESKYGRAPEQPTRLPVVCDSCGARFWRVAPYPAYRGPMGTHRGCGGTMNVGDDAPYPPQQTPRHPR